MDEAVVIPIESLRRLFAPASIAILGASSDSSKAGGRPIDYLARLGYRGAVYPVNPSRSEIGGLKCYPSLKAVPDAVDLCIVTLPAQMVEAALRECVDAGVRAVVVFSSGFAEVGPEGRVLQQRIADIARANGIALCGPNCLGLINVETGAAATFTTALARSQRVEFAPLGFVSQSGALAASILATMQDNGFGLSHFITTGNEAALGFTDYAEYLITQTDVRAVAGYLEGIDGPALIELSRKALALGKPLVLMKVGSSAAGARASLAHTGNLVGDEAVNREAFRQLGIIRAETIDELLDYSHAFTRSRPPRGRRVAIVSISGGGGILMADWCEKLGLELAPFAEETKSRLKEVLPWFASTSNPLDTTGRPLWDEAMLENALASVAADEGVDMVLVYVGLATGASERISGEIRRVAASTDKPVLVCWLPEPDPAPQASLRAAGIPVYPEPVRMVKVAAKLVEYRGAVDRAKAAQQRAASGRRFDSGSLPRGGSIAEHAAKKLLASAGIEGPREALASSADEAIRHARQIGYPVCLKVVSPDIPHRTEIGGVRLGLADDPGVGAAYAELMEAALTAVPGARIEGILVQEMVSGGFELMVSGFRDPSFGPAVMCGSGGVLVEVLGDRAIRLAPVSGSQAIEMLRELRAAPLLEGFRGSPPLDIEAAAQAICTLSEIISTADEALGTIEINPLMVLPRGRGVRALDALITGEPLNETERT